MLYDDDFGTAESAAEVPSTRSPSESSASNAIAEGSGHTSSPPPVFHPLAYRGVVANWPVDWRERWGRRRTLWKKAVSPGEMQKPRPSWKSGISFATSRLPKRPPIRRLKQPRDRIDQQSPEASDLDADTG